MAGEDTDGAQNLEYEVTLVSTNAFFTRSMSENVELSVFPSCISVFLACIVFHWCSVGGVWNERLGGLVDHCNA